ncbi:MAG: hypothetical protein Q8O87_04015 [bacterium]|nr:hypothetical protein [bacterium]
MKSLLKAFYIGGFLLAMPSLALATPGIPHQFYGAVSYTNGTIPADGSSVEAKIGGVVVKSSTVTNGKYGYSPNLFMVTDPDSSRKGQTINFWLGGVHTGQTAIFDNGGYANLNLSTAAPVVNTPSGGGGGSVSTPTPSPSPSPSASAVPLSLEAKKADTNNDGKIDVLDFNSLMVNWGSFGSMADFTGDGQVDVFDFNYLMIYWTV